MPANRVDELRSILGISHHGGDSPWEGAGVVKYVYFGQDEARGIHESLICGYPVPACPRCRGDLCSEPAFGGDHARCWLVRCDRCLRCVLVRAASTLSGPSAR